MSLNYHNKKFKILGEEEKEGTTFQYFQEGNILWGEYKGGSVLKGSLIAKIDDNNVLQMHYQHLTTKEEFKLGKCISTPTLLEDGRIQIHEIYESVGTETVNKGEITLIEIK